MPNVLRCQLRSSLSAAGNRRPLSSANVRRSPALPAPLPAAVVSDSQTWVLRHLAEQPRGSVEVGDAREGSLLPAKRVAPGSDLGIPQAALARQRWGGRSWILVRGPNTSSDSTRARRGVSAGDRLRHWAC